MHMQKNDTMNQNCENRYTRQTSLPEIGEEGQRRLHESRVLIVGLGGLGSPTAMYLAAAGVGTLGLMDDDLVSPSNLQRQILYTEDDLGQPKAICASRRLHALNNHLKTEVLPIRLTQENANSIIPNYDIVVDGCDNFATRYLLSDTTQSFHIPYIYGAICGFEGQVSVFNHHSDPHTYRDLYPDEAEMVHLPPDRRVLGAICGIVGSVQASEAIKAICGFGEPLHGKLWTIDLRTMQSHIILL